MSGKCLSMLYYFSDDPPAFECCLVLQNGEKFQAIFLGLASNLLGKKHKISVYYVEWRVVSYLLLALIVQLVLVCFLLLKIFAQT